MTQNTNTKTQPDFAALLRTVTTEPGTLSRAYSLFWNYSLGNQMLAWGQCLDRGIDVGPIASFNRWKDLGRHVKRGEKAIELCMPVSRKRNVKNDDGTEETVHFKTFMFKRNWFVLAQTDGEPYTPPAPPTWDRATALSALDIAEIPFTVMNGNVQGFASFKSISVSPIAVNPFKTTFHEIAHILLGHTSEDGWDPMSTPRNLREAEAESVAMLVCAALELPGLDEARGYVQNWWGTGRDIPEASARKIFNVADQILKAGVVSKHDSAIDADVAA